MGFFDKENPNANFAIAVLVETHHRGEDDCPALFKKYKEILDLVVIVSLLTNDYFLIYYVYIDEIFNVTSIYISIYQHISCTFFENSLENYFTFFMWLQNEITIWCI